MTGGSHCVFHIVNQLKNELMIPSMALIVALLIARHTPPTVSELHRPPPGKFPPHRTAPRRTL